MKFFKWRIISEESYIEYRRSYILRQSVINCHRWFSGWKDLDIIWDYLMADTYFGTIESCRREYSKARGTDEYGNPTQPKAESGEK